MREGREKDREKIDRVEVTNYLLEFGSKYIKPNHISLCYLTILSLYSQKTRKKTFKGNDQSLPLEMCSHFDPDEIARLGKRFKKLDLDNSGSLSVDEFMRSVVLSHLFFSIGYIKIY